MTNQHHKVFQVDGVQLHTVIKKQSPWVYEDSVSIPLCTWETLVELMDANHPEQSQLIQHFLDDGVANKDVNAIHGALSVLHEMANHLALPKYLSIIENRIALKQDVNLELSEYRRIIGNIVALFTEAAQHEIPIDSWIG